ncbi:MAG: hypothetical protein RLZZ598_1024 [Pseudomonadota bacterium]|jgi:PAS domain S-box-containing protein
MSTSGVIIAVTAALIVITLLVVALLMRRLAAANRALRAKAAQSSTAQRELRESRRRLQLLLDHMPDGVLAFGADGRVEWINPAARSIFHCNAADAVGRPASALIPAIDTLLPGGSATTPEGMVPAQVPRLSTFGRRRDGGDFPLEIAVVWLRTDGPRAAMCVCRDITDAERVERIKSEFVSMVSHELRTPLTSLRGSLALLADGSIAGLPTDARRLLRLASSNAERLVTLVNDILDYERLRAGALKVEIEALDLGEVARRAIDSLEGLARPAGVRFALTGDGDVPVLADASRLMQVLANLLSNAIKYSPPDGTVRVRLAHADERAFLTVMDEGPGIPPEFVPRLFQPFEQAPDPRHRKRGGSGLGLAISRGLMEMMNGAIGIAAPARGRGAEFWIALPLNSARPSTFFGDLD